MRKALVRRLSIRVRLMRMLSISISFPIFQRAVLYTLSISVKITNLKEVPSYHAEHTRKELVRMLSIRVRN